MHPILVFKNIKDVCCTVIQPWKVNSSKKFIPMMSVCKLLTLQL